MMQISLVTETYPPEVNGVAMTLSRLAEGLGSRGHRVTIVRPRNGAAPKGGVGIDHFLVRGSPLPGYPGLQFGLPSSRRLRERWTDARPDLVHVATEGPLGWSAIRSARRLGIPVTSSFHTNFHQYCGYYGLGLLRRAGAAYLRAVHNRTRRTFVPTRRLAERLGREGYHNLGVLGRGVDSTRFHPGMRDRALRHSWGADDQTPVVIHVGRIAPEENLEHLATAFDAAREAGAVGVVVGDGPVRARWARDHPDWRFAGERKGEDLARHFASGDVFVFPSLTDTFGNVVLEAMASGLAVVAYDTAAAAELISDRSNGRVLPEGDAAGLARAVTELVTDPSLRAGVRRAARDSAAGRAWGAVVDEFESNLVAARGATE